VDNLGLWITAHGPHSVTTGVLVVRWCRQGCVAVALLLAPAQHLFWLGVTGPCCTGSMLHADWLVRTTRLPTKLV